MGVVVEDLAATVAFPSIRAPCWSSACGP